MSDIWKLIIEKQNQKKPKIKVKNPKEIIFYFLDKDGDVLVKGWAFNVDIKKLDFVKDYTCYYHPFSENNFGMFKIDLQREFANIGASFSGELDDEGYTIKYGFGKDIPVMGFKYKIVKR